MGDKSTDSSGSDISSAWRVRVERDVCIGSGICIHLAARAFILVDGRAQPTGDGAEGGDIVDAADSCPVEAITVTDLRTGAIVAPAP